MAGAETTTISEDLFLRVRLEAVCASVLPMFVMNLLGSGLMAWSFWTLADARWLSGWMMGNAVALTARVAVARGFTTRRFPGVSPRIWSRLLIGLTFVTGLSWGGLLGWMATGGSDNQIMIAVCISFGAITMAMMNVTYWPIYVAFQLPVTTIAAIGFALSQRPGHVSLAIGAAAITGALLAVSYRLAGQVLRAHRLALDNQALIDSLGERGRELEQACDALERVSLTDPLTGLANRRSRDDRLAAEWQRALRHGGSLAVIAIDVDHFKRYNDTHGHAEGDRCLQAVAEMLLAGTRGPIDMATRHGGEEFMLVLPGISLDAAASIAERVRVKVATCSAEPRFALPEKVTISLGVAALEPAPGRSVHELTIAADAALYRAKMAGRNCYELATELNAPAIAA